MNGTQKITCILRVRVDFTMATEELRVKKKGTEIDTVISMYLG